MEVIPEWVPNIHPLVVHFPVAILFIAALMNLFTFFVPDEWWDERKNTILYVIGTLTVLAAYFTGQSAADSVFLETEAQSVLSHHADLAFWLAWFFGLYAVLRIFLHKFGLMEKMSFKIITFITVIPGLFLIYKTAEHGGELVFGYGTGTGQLLQTEESSGSTTPAGVDSLRAVSAFTVRKNEDWTWEMTAGSVGDLISNFHWLEGSVHQLHPTALQGSQTLLQLNAPGEPNFFVTHSAYQNVQIDSYLDITDFNGELSLVHHVQDVGNFDFVSLHSDGTIAQGRINNGESTIFEDGSFENEGLMFVRVVGNGTHFRGYVNREMKVHGHGNAPEAGFAGLRINGEGIILLSNIELTQLH